MTLTSGGSVDGVQTSPAAHAVDLCKTYGAGQAAVHALAGVNVTFERGRFTAVMGPSGSGKSTLMHCMAGLDRPTSGQTFVGGQDVGRLDDAGLTRLRRDKIGFVFQSFNLVPTLTAAENITLPADLAGAKIDRDWLGYLVKQLGIEDRLTHRPSELSGGQAQRVAIARALVTRPSVLLLDEPFSALDAFTRSELQDHLLDLWDEARPILVLVTHDIEEALVLASRIAVMRSPPGRIAGIIDVPLPRPRDRLSPAFEEQKRRVLGLLDAALSRPARKAALHVYQI